MNTTTTTTDWLREQLDTPGLAPVATQKRQDEQPAEVNKRRTRYGITPVWPLNVNARDYYVWTIPANQIFPFRYFLGERSEDLNGKLMYEHWRETQDQIADIRRTSTFFVELPELFEFDEATADRIAQIIRLPRACTKYGAELDRGCTSCWLAYLEHDVVARIENELEGIERTAAYAITRKIIPALETALAECRKQVTVSLTALDDARDPKTTLNDHDLANIYHTHQDRPKFKTAVNRESELADTISNAFEKLAQVLTPQQPATQQLPLDTATLRAQLAEIQKQLEEAEKNDSPLTPTQEASMTAADRMAKVRAAKKPVE